MTPATFHNRGDFILKGGQMDSGRLFRGLAISLLEVALDHASESH